MEEKTLNEVMKDCQAAVEDEIERLRKENDRLREKLSEHTGNYLDMLVDHLDLQHKYNVLMEQNDRLQTFAALVSTLIGRETAQFLMNSSKRLTKDMEELKRRGEEADDEDEEE